MAHIAFIGLGVMGYPIAGHLAAAGHDVTVYNRTQARVQQWLAQHKGSGATTPRGAAGGAEFVFACVGQDADLREVCLGADGAFAGMDAGTIFVDHTTVSASVTRELHALAAARDIAFIDAPVSGGQAGAENGALSVMCGGDAAPFERAAPVIAAYARICRLIGVSGAGQITKM
ncbi:MAG: NAD(P)-dependent oxidoreductase, partial [Paracoccaceae bacterium]